MPWASDELRAWLTATRTANGTYDHLLLVEDIDARDEGIEALRVLVAQAHADARGRLSALAGISLDPLDETGLPGELPYPDGLHTVTLQGYLGEIMAGLVAVNYKPHGRTWEVPAFLFRFDTAAVQALEGRRQLGGGARQTPGRTGDDCVAFVRDDTGRIVEWLKCEAKCSLDHNASLISDGHVQLNKELTAPVDLLQLIEILEDSTIADAKDWVDALRLMRAETRGEPKSQRFDLFMYVCGRAPKQASTWLPTQTPQSKYERDGPLAAAELHLGDVKATIEFVYPDHATPS
jgi:hypothetical protein